MQRTGISLLICLWWVLPVLNRSKASAASCFTTVLWTATNLNSDCPRRQCTSLHVETPRLRIYLSASCWVWTVSRQPSKWSQSRNTADIIERNCGRGRTWYSTNLAFSVSEAIVPSWATLSKVCSGASKSFSFDCAKNPAKMSTNWRKKWHKPRNDRRFFRLPGWFCQSVASIVRVENKRHLKRMTWPRKSIRFVKIAFFKFSITFSSCNSANNSRVRAISTYGMHKRWQ